MTRPVSYLLGSVTTPAEIRLEFPEGDATPTPAGADHMDYSSVKLLNNGGLNDSAELSDNDEVLHEDQIHGRGSVNAMAEGVA